MIKNVGFVLLFSLALMMASCNNELDLTAEYDETIVVYSLLDHTQDTQFVKINKSFLGDGNALDYAQEPDSFIYDNVYASLTNLNDQTVLVLTPHNAPKEKGVFSNERNVVYITDQKLVPGAKYQLDVINNNSGEAAKATAVVIDTVPLLKPFSFPQAPVYLKTQAEYLDFTFSYALKPNVFRYESTVIFHYLEYAKANPSVKTSKRIEFDLGTRLASSAMEGSISFTIDGENFYKKVAQNVQPDPDLEREIVDMEFLIRAASKELQLYMDVNGDLEGISTVRPDFSNIENGYGLFSSKYENSQHRFLDIPSAQELKVGRYTSRLGFVDNL